MDSHQSSAIDNLPPSGKQDAEALLHIDFFFSVVAVPGHCYLPGNDFVDGQSKLDGYLRQPFPLPDMSTCMSKYQ